MPPATSPFAHPRRSRPSGAPGAERRITLAFLGAAVLLLGIGIVTAWGFRRISGARQEREQAVAVRDRLSRLLAHLQDAETGQRGFLLTGRLPYLGPFETGTMLVRADVDTLVQLTAADSALAVPVRALTPAIEAKLAELTLTVNLRRTRGLDAALNVVLTDQGRFLMDSVRHVIRTISGVESSRYQRAGTGVDAASRWVRVSTVVGVFLSIVFLAIAASALARDRSTRLEVEARLEEVTEELRDLYEQAPCGYHSLDVDGLIVRMNQTECRWLGYRPDELVGKRLVFDLLAPDDRPGARARFERLLKGEDIGTGEARFVRKDGSRLAAFVSTTLVRDAAGAPWRIRATLLDQTEYRNARELVDRLNAQLQRSVAELEDVNRQLESFSYSVSHDLRAPLRAIAGFARLLKEEHTSGLDPEGLRLLGVIHVNTERMGRLIDDLLSLSRLSRAALVRSPVDMTALVRAVVADRKAAGADDGVEIVWSELPPAEGDPALLQQVWERLIDNATKFTADASAPRIEIGARTDQATTVYTVRDNGVGLDMRYADKVFEVFQRLHPQSEYEGTGVGLAIVQRVVHRHGGRVWVESAPGRGATFFFTLGAKGGRDGRG